MTEATKATNDAANNNQADEEAMAQAAAEADAQSEANDTEDIQEMAAADIFGGQFSVEEVKDKFTKKDLVSFAEEWNETQDLDAGDPAYVGTSSSKSEIVEAMMDNESLHRSGMLITSVSREKKTVPYGTVGIHPRNYRHHPSDYDDQRLQNSMKMDGGLKGSLEVVPADDDADVDWWIESGNRRWSNFGALLREEGMSEDGVLNHPIDIEVAEREGGEREVGIMEIVSMVNANDTQKPLSPIDHMHAWNDLRAMGLTLSDVKEKLGGDEAPSVSYISRICRLERLPKDILDRVHFEHNKEALEAKPVEKLENMGVPVYFDDDMNLHVEAITLNNAHQLNRLFDKDKVETFEKFCLDRDEEFTYQGAYYTGGVFKAAQVMSESGFKKFIRTLSREERWGLLEPTSDTSSSKDEDKVKDEDKGKADDKAKQQAKGNDGDDDGTEPKSSKKSDSEDTFDVQEFTAHLSMDDYVVVDDWASKLADECRNANVDLVNAAKALVANGILKLK